MVFAGKIWHIPRRYGGKQHTAVLGHASTHRQHLMEVDVARLCSTRTHMENIPGRITEAEIVPVYYAV